MEVAAVSLDVIFWIIFAACAAVVAWGFISIIWESLRPWGRSGSRPSGGGGGGAGGSSSDGTYSAMAVDFGSSGVSSSDIGGGDSSGGGDTSSGDSGGDFSGGGGDFGGGGSTGGWSD